MADESKQIGIIGLDENGEPTVREPIFLNLSSYKNSKFLDIRKHYKDSNDNTWKPTKKGVTFHVDQLNEFLEIIKKNDEEIKGWFADEE